MYGSSFISPVGENFPNPSPITTSPFQYTALYVLAAEDNTTVTLPDSSTRRLAMGQTTVISGVARGARVTSDKPVRSNMKCEPQRTPTVADAGTNVKPYSFLCFRFSLT
jgi:hypothetical protein